MYKYQISQIPLYSVHIYTCICIVEDIPLIIYLHAGSRNVPSSVVVDRLTVRLTWTILTNETRSSTRKHQGFMTSTQQKSNKTWKEEQQFSIHFSLIILPSTLTFTLFPIIMLQLSYNNIMTLGKWGLLM